MNNNYIKTSSAKLSVVSYEKSKNEAEFFLEVELKIGGKEIYICNRVLSEFDNKNYVYLRKNLLIRWFVDF